MPLPREISPTRSPLLDKEYEYRFIDFEHWVKCNFTALGAKGVYGGLCLDAFDEISHGWGHIHPEDELSSDEDM